jgi:hypothetical protein
MNTEAKKVNIPVTMSAEEWDMAQNRAEELGFSSVNDYIISLIMLHEQENKLEAEGYNEHIENKEFLQQVIDNQEKVKITPHNHA